MPDLATVVKGWNDLPPALKAGIVAMVQSACHPTEEGRG